MNDEIHPDFRSGAKLGGELVNEYDFVDFKRGKGSWFILEIDSDEVAPPWGELTGKAAQHGFRVAHFSDSIVRFVRMDNDPTDPRND